MQAIREALPLSRISDKFPQLCDQRIDSVALQSCPEKFSLGWAQFWYSGDQYKERYDRDLEVVANSLGMTALMLASLEGDLKAARILLRRGASVGLVNCYGRTALILAAMAGRDEIVKLLLSVDVPIDVVDSFGRNALEWAEARGHKHIAILVRKAAHERRDWRMAQLQEREAHRAAHAARTAAGGSAEPFPDAADAFEPNRPYNGVSDVMSSRRPATGRSYMTPTSSRHNVSPNRQPYRSIGPIGFGVLSARGGPGALKHGIPVRARGATSRSTASGGGGGGGGGANGVGSSAGKVARGILSVRSGGTSTGRRGFLSRRGAGEAAAESDGGNWFSRAMGGMLSKRASPKEPMNGAAAPSKQLMADEGSTTGHEQRPKWAPDVAEYDGSARGGAKSSVRGSARSFVSSARSAVFSSRSMPGMISHYGVPGGARPLSASTNPALDLFLSTQAVKASGAHGGAHSDRDWVPAPMSALPVGMAARRRHDREWEAGLRDKHEQRVSPEEVAKYKSTRRRHWVNSSRRWIERRKEVAANMTPKERKLSRQRLYSSPRHKFTTPRVYA